MANFMGEKILVFSAATLSAYGALKGLLINTVWNHTKYSLSRIAILCCFWVRCSQLLCAQENGEARYVQLKD
jgi:hypothetical protein